MEVDLENLIQIIEYNYSGLKHSAYWKDLLKLIRQVDKWKKFVEWIGSHGPYWFYDEEKKYWIGTPYELPSTERLWEIWEKNIYPSIL